jgi:hypothetical protein
MDPRTSEILAMAVTHALDPSGYWKYGEVFPGIMAYNRAIGTTYEPGPSSRCSPPTAWTPSRHPDTSYLDTGVIMVGGVPSLLGPHRPRPADHDRLHATFAQRLPFLDRHRAGPPVSTAT